MKLKIMTPLKKVKNKMKPSAEKEGYEFYRYLDADEKLALFQENIICGTFEVWQSNPNHASYGFSYGGTDWEFVCEYRQEDWE